MNDYLALKLKHTIIKMQVKNDGFQQVPPLVQGYSQQQLNLAKTAPYNYIHSVIEKIAVVLQPEYTCGDK